MEIFLVRHPPVSWTGLCYGRLEAPLVEDWQRGLAPLQAALPEPLPQVYSSPAQRCLSLAQTLSPEVQVEPLMAEMNFGTWEGLAWKDIPRADLSSWSEDLANHTPHQGESGVELLDRARQFWETLRARDQDALLVSHAGWIRALFAVLLNCDLAHAFRLNVDFLSLSKLVCSKKQVQLTYINRTWP